MDANSNMSSGWIQIRSRFGKIAKEGGETGFEVAALPKASPAATPTEAATPASATMSAVPAEVPAEVPAGIPAVPPSPTVPVAVAAPIVATPKPILTAKAASIVRPPAPPQQVVEVLEDGEHSLWRILWGLLPYALAAWSPPKTNSNFKSITFVTPTTIGFKMGTPMV